MPTIRAVDADVFVRKPALSKATSELDPELAMMVSKISTITDASVVYEVSLQPGDKAGTIRVRLLRAARLAGVDVAVRKSPKGWYVGLMTPERRSKAGRKPSKPAATA